MGRIRSIKPEFPQSPTIGRVSRDARLLFVQLFTICDDDGRTRADIRLLASLLYPYDPDALGLIETWLVDLEAVGAVRRYVVAGEKYLDIPKWLEHQKIDRRTASKLPAFVAPSRGPHEPSSSPRRVLDESSSPDLDLDLDHGSGSGRGSGSGADRARELDESSRAIVEDSTKALERAATPPATKHPPALIDGRDLRRHGLHAWCDFTRGLCVVLGQHLEFKKRLGGLDAEAERQLLAWYPTVVARYRDTPSIGDRLFDFWANEFGAWVGTVTRRPGAETKAERSAESFDRMGDRLEALNERRVKTS